MTIHRANGSSIEASRLADTDDALYELRGGLVSMIFQEPMTAFSSVHTIGNQICEAIRLHQRVTRREAQDVAVAMLRKVGIPGPEARFKQFPFEMSGGMRQRAMIAMALASKPELLIADEPTTALDVTIQAQIMVLLKSLQEEMGLSVLLITHDLAVVAQLADEVAVMYLGRIVEHAAMRSILKSPRHPYTRALLESLPGLSGHGKRLTSIRGNVPSLAEVPPGCPFHPRCPYAEKGRCDAGIPPSLEILEEEHTVACFRTREIQP